MPLPRGVNYAATILLLPIMLLLDRPWTMPQAAIWGVSGMALIGLGLMFIDGRLPRRVATSGESESNSRMADAREIQARG
jgi:hypothetical protein